MQGLWCLKIICTVQARPTGLHLNPSWANLSSPTLDCTANLQLQKRQRSVQGLYGDGKTILKYQNIFQLNHIEKDNFRLNSDK